MASLSATSLRFCFSANQVNTSQINRGTVKLVSVGWGRSSAGFPSLRTSRFRVAAQAKAETIDKVISIVRKQLALPAETKVSPESTFTKDLGADSLDTVEIVMALEEEFGIAVEEENSENIVTVQDAADLIEKLVEKK
ncbi:acyl carrier protein-like isoform X1 [Solanum tuberosum]|uniref:acyl carrier protein-like isoform X1 n=1 Tax=Solanum tuberosum TaxID=4113 RepID=UPI0003D275B1|nr:PREDICTED: acyl carrier protein-like isoform X1 [Solanum tuberosum]